MTDFADPGNAAALLEQANVLCSSLSDTGSWLAKMYGFNLLVTLSNQTFKQHITAVYRVPTSRYFDKVI